MLGRLIQPEIRDMIESRDWRQLREVLTDLSVPDVAEILPDVAPKDRAVLFRMLPRERATEVFEHFEPDDQQELLEALKDAEAARVLNDMAPDDRTDLLGEMPDRVARRVLRLLSPEERAISQSLLAYPEYSVGRLMTPEYVKVKRHQTVGGTIEFLRRVAADKEMVDYVYVVDEENRPAGVVSLSQLVFAPDDRKVGDLLNAENRIVQVRADADQGDAVSLMLRYDIKAIPVVDSQEHLVGIVTFDDVMDVQEEQATADMHLMSGVVPTEGAYTTARFFDLLKNRLGALVILAVTATLAGVVLHEYQQSLAEDFESLVPFIIVLMAASGNTGSQVGTLMIRAMAVEEIRAREVRLVAIREVLMGVVLGTCLGAVVVAMGIGLFDDVSPPEALVTGGSLAVAVALCNMLGVMLPVALRAIRLDPAFFANPLITTLSDFTALFIFFEAAKLLLD